MSRLGNQWTEDSFLQALVIRLAGRRLSDAETADMEGLGRRAVEVLWPMAMALDEDDNLPRARHFDAWGRRADRVITHPAWTAMKHFVASERLLCNGYAPMGASSLRVHWTCRLIQFARLVMFNASSAMYSCPLAASDGAAHVLRMFLGIGISSLERENVARYFDPQPSPAAREFATEALSRLTSTDPQRFWTSGQWMTERGGGSDVAEGTQTIARRLPDGTFALFGFKWFTSAVCADVTITLARIEEDGETANGSAGLSCFALRVWRDDGSLNNIRVVRLKNKLGTRQLPTAELELLGAVAHLVSLPGKGVACITSAMVNITRLHNAIQATSLVRRMVALARDDAHRRSVSNEILASQALHVRSLAGLDVNYRACALLTLEMCAMVGVVETWDESTNAACPLPGAAGKLTVDEISAVVRLLTPIMKALTAKLAVSSCSEGLELFFEDGIDECTGLPCLLRDAQVLPLWEGTTNVQSADFLRALGKSRGTALVAVSKLIELRCTQVTSKDLLELAKTVKQTLGTVRTFVHNAVLAGRNGERSARPVMMGLGAVVVASQMLEHAQWSGDFKDVYTASRWIAQEVLPVPKSISNGWEVDMDLELALDFDPASGAPRGCGDSPERARL